MLEDGLFRTLFEQSGFALELVDADGRRIASNRAWRELWGPAAESVFEDERLTRLGLQPHVEQAFRGELSVVPELRYDPAAIGRTGTSRWLRAIFRPMRTADGAVQAVAIAVEDITERKTSEDTSHETEARFRALFENPAVAISVCDVEGRVVEANGALYEMLGLKPGGAPSVETFDRLTHPDDRAADAARFQALADGRREHYRQEKRYVLDDGRLVWADLSIFLVRDAKGEPQYTVGMVKDITEQKLAQAERERLQDELRQAQKLEAIGRLAGGVAHDFNNMLGAILGYNEFLLDGLAKDDPRRHDAEEIAHAAERARMLTRQLLAFGRRQVLRPENLDLNDVVSEMEKLLRPLIGVDIELVTLSSPHVGLVKADRGQLEQVIINLALNARDAMPNGGKLVIETGEVDLRERYLDQHLSLDPGLYVVLGVRDTGVGMSPETQTRIFEPFFTTKAAGEGTGLGLATVYGIVEQSGGKIFVYSEPTLGTTFKIYLPQTRRAAGAPRPSPARRVDTRAAESLRGSEAVLVVEDEDILRSLVSRVLRQHGYHVVEASYGKEALELWGRRQAEIDLVLADVVMPGMTGVELAGKLVHQRPGTRVVLTSGYADESILQRDRIPPRTSFLQKPFTAEALLRTVRETLDRQAWSAHDGRAATAENREHSL